MADTKIPDIDLKTAIALREAFGFFYPEVDPEKQQALRKAFGYFGDLDAPDEPKNFTDPKSGIQFATSAEFIDNLRRLGIPKETSVKHIGITLENWYENLIKGPEGPTMKGAPETVASSMPDKFLRENQAETLEVRAPSDVESRENAKTIVDEGLKRQREIYDEQIKLAEAAKEKLEKENESNGERNKVYTQVEEKETRSTLTEDLQEKREQFIEEVKNEDPKEAIRKVSGVIQSRVPDIDPSAADIAATEVVSYIDRTYITPVNLAVAEAAKEKPEISAMAAQVAIQEKARKEVADLVITMAFGEEGRKDLLPEVKVNVSETSKPDYQPSSFTLPARFIETVKDQKAVLNNPSITKPEWMRSWTERQIEMAAEGIQGMGSFKSGPLQGYRGHTEEYLATYTFIRRPGTIWQPSEGPHYLDIASGAAEPFNIVGGLVQNVAVGKAKDVATKFVAQKLGTQVATKAASAVATKVATKLGFKAALQAIGTAIPGLGNAAAFVLGEVVDWIKNKIPWKKIKEWSAAIVGGLAGLIALPFLGLGAAIGIGAGATAISLGLGGGLGSVTLGGIGAGIGGFFGALAGAALGAIGIPILVILLGFPVVVALILFIINSGAYLVPPAPVNLSAGASIVSPYIDVTKSANPTGPFQNSNLPVTVEYQISVSAKKGPLTNIRIKHDCTVIKKTGSAACPQTDPAIPGSPDSISPAGAFSFSYKQTFTSPDFQDSLISDTITVTADSAEQKDAVAAASAGVKIGNPPDSCPNGWPVSGHWVITQTPGGSYSHAGIEAIDIATTMGTPVRATHSGIANVFYTSSSYRPVYVTVTSNCGGNTFSTWYAHLSAVSVSNGQQVTMGQVLGASGTEGSGAHLHYEFRGLKMSVPYIPKAIIRNCSNDLGQCGYVP